MFCPFIEIAQGLRTPHTPLSSECIAAGCAMYDPYHQACGLAPSYKAAQALRLTVEAAIDGLADATHSLAIVVEAWAKRGQS